MIIKFIFILIAIILLQCNPAANDENKELGLLSILLINAQKLGRYSHTSVSIGNNILESGGQNHYIVFNDIFQIDSILNKIIQVNIMEFVRSNIKSIRLLGGRVSIISGNPCLLRVALYAGPLLVHLCEH